ncbi:hypothetical protein GCM10010277_62980 [Streptomyces longisporoflavus]|nr:hypothetical protein GCM10010277_62980 [Streptomyces longisporoflavus]
MKGIAKSFPFGMALERDIMPTVLLSDLAAIRAPIARTAQLDVNCNQFQKPIIPPVVSVTCA